MSLKTFLISNADSTRFRINGLIPSSRLPNKRHLCQAFRDHVLYGVQELPPKVDLRPDMTPVENQSSIGSCAANSLAGAYEYLTKKANGHDTDVSRLFIYYNARVKDQNSENVTDSGCTLTSVIETLEEFGTCLESTWPYDISRVNARPSYEAYLEAKNHTITEALQLGVNLHEMKSCLAQGFPFVFGLKLFTSFAQATTTGVVPMPNMQDTIQQSYGSHALLAVGYSDQLQVFIVRNSWGENWGDKGYCYIPYNYLTDPNLCFDVWTVRKLAIDNFNSDNWNDYGPVNYNYANGFGNSYGNDAIIRSINESDDDDNNDGDDDDDDDNNDGDDDDDDNRRGSYQPWNPYVDNREYEHRHRKHHHHNDQDQFTNRYANENFSNGYYNQFQENTPFDFSGNNVPFNASWDNSSNVFNYQFAQPSVFPGYQRYGDSYGYTNPYNNYSNPFF